jgi:hypothetical protein
MGEERPLARLVLTDRTVRCALLRRDKLEHAGWLQHGHSLRDQRTLVPPWIVCFGMPRDYDRESWFAFYDFLMMNERRQWRGALSPTGRELGA